MKDGRPACRELCEASRLALCLARLGREAGLHRAPLFSVSGGAPSGQGPGTVREPNGRLWGATPEATAVAKTAPSADGKAHAEPVIKDRRAANKIR
jgi:hypothetical protein